MATTTKKPTRRGGNVKVAPKHEKMIPVRITPDLLDRVDAIKPAYIPREPWVRHVLDIGIRVIESEEKAA